MQERNIISGTTAAFTAPLVEAWDSLLPFLIFAIVLTLLDVRYGILAAKKRGENIRKSRAVRRTINKVVDFICWLSISWCLGHTFAHVFDIPLLPLLVLAIIYGVELSSVADNYCEYKGLSKRLNLIKLTGMIFKKADISGAIEEKTENENNK